MKSLSNHRPRRTTTVATLVGTLARASGMANACLLEPPSEHAHVAASRASDAHHTQAGDALVVDVDALAVDHDDDADVPNEPGLKSCDDGSTEQIRLQAAVDFANAVPAPFVVFAGKATTPVGSAQIRFDDLQVPVVGPPV